MRSHHLEVGGGGRGPSRRKPDQSQAEAERDDRVVRFLTFELNGHFVGGFEPADLLYTALVERRADALGF